MLFAFTDSSAIPVAANCNFISWFAGCKLCYSIYLRSYRDIIFMQISRLGYEAWWMLVPWITCTKCGVGSNSACAKCCRYVERCIQAYITDRVYLPNCESMYYFIFMLW